MTEKKSLYAIHVNAEDRVDWVGEIVDESDRSFTVKVVSAFMLHAGFWEETDEIRVCPKNECRLFETRDLAATEALKFNTRT